MRAEADELEFKDFLLDMGQGRLPLENGHITIPEQFAVPVLEDLIAFVFGDLSGDLSHFAILCPTNFICEYVNNKIVDKLEGSLQELRSIDDVVCESME